MGSYIIGFDSDKTDIFDRQLEFIYESGVPTAMVNLLNAIPRTKLWYRLKEEGRVKDDLFIDTHGDTNIIPKMEKNILITGYKNVMRSLYEPSNFYDRLKVFMTYYSPRSKSKINYAKIKALGKSILYVGLLGNGTLKWYYWKMFFYSLVCYPRLFTKVITIMTCSLHYYRYVKKL